MEIGSGNLILKFVCALIDLCPSTLSSQVAANVGQVLGEIGPRDLECIALPSVRNQCEFISPGFDPQSV